MVRNLSFFQLVKVVNILGNSTCQFHVLIGGNVEGISKWLCIQVCGVSGVRNAGREGKITFFDDAVKLVFKFPLGVKGV